MKETVLAINEKVINGEMDALKAYIILKDMENTIKEVLKGIKDEAIDVAETYGKGEHSAFGAKFQVKNGPSRWNFKGVPDWQIKNVELKALEDRLKKLAEAGLDLADTSTGEEIILPTKTLGATTISIKC